MAFRGKSADRGISSAALEFEEPIQCPMNLNCQTNKKRWNSRPIFSVRIGTSSWRNWLTGFGKRGGDRSVRPKLTGSQQSEPRTHRYRLQVRLLHSRPPRSTPQKDFTGNPRLFVAALEGAVVVGGLSALGAGLLSLGIPKNSVVKYEASIKAGKFVLVAHGTAEEAAKARDMLCLRAISDPTA